MARPARPTPRPLPSRYDKDVGICTVEKELDTQGRETILNITASNGYPSYWCTTHAYAINTGTIPLKLQDIVLIGADGGGLLDQPIRETEVWCVDTGLITDALLLGLFISPTPIPPCQENDFDVLVQSPGDFDLQIMWGCTTASSGIRWTRYRRRTIGPSARSRSTWSRAQSRTTLRRSRSSSSGCSGTSSYWRDRKQRS